MSLLDFFQTSKDTNLNDEDAIQPVEDGEAANQVTYRRPSENLRYRTEVLREAHDSEEAVALQDRGMLIVQNAADPPVMTWGGTVANGGSGNPVLTGDDLNVVSTASSASSVGGVLTANSFITQFNFDDGAGATLTITPHDGVDERRMFEGAGNIFFRTFRTTAVGAHDPIVTVSGTDPEAGPVDILVELDNDGAGGTNNTNEDIADAINAVAGINNIIRTLHGGAHNALSAAFLAETATRRRLFEFPTYGLNGLDAVSFTIPAATISALDLLEGDIAVVDWASAMERRSENWGVPLVADVKVITSDVHSNVGNNQVFPLFKVFNDTLHFFNGIVCPKDVSVSLVHDYPSRAAYDAHAEVVVGSDPGCDYDNIQDAIDELVAAAGGTIRVKAGTYNLVAAGLTIAAGVPALEIVGEAPGEVIINVAALGGHANLTIGGPGNHVFRNLTFTQNDNAESIITSTGAATSGGRTDVVVFDHCTFERDTAAGPTAMIYEQISTRYLHCQFIGFSPTLDIAIEIVPPDANLNAVVEHAYFSKLVSGIIDETAAFVVESIACRYCTIENCGNTTLADWSYFIHVGLSVAAYADVDISYNHWRNVGTANAQCGGFCYVKGRGLIANNQLDRLIKVNNVGAASYMIYCPGAVTAVTRLGVTIQNNTLNCGSGADTSAGGIRGGRVLHNSLYEYIPRDAGQYAIRTESAGLLTVVEGNYIQGHTSGAMAGASLIFINVAGSRVANNTIYIEQDDVYAIDVDSGGNSVITQNYITFVGGPTGTVGIHVDDSDCVVSGNIISDPEIGINATNQGTDANVSGNTITSGGTVADAVGILLSSQNVGSTVTNNVIQDFEIGIQLFVSGNNAPKQYVISGNNIYVRGDAGAYCIQYTGNPGAVVHTLGVISGNRLENWDPANGYGIEFGGANVQEISCLGNMFFDATHNHNNDNNTIGIGTSGACVMTSNWDI